MIFFYSCSECGKKYPIKPDIMLCVPCSAKQKPEEPLKGILNVNFTITQEDKERIKKSFNIHDFLPVEKEYFPSIPVGNTPLWRPEKLRKKTGFANLFIKDDSLNPTGSLKDRASFLVAAFAIKNNIKKITLASTGNAGSSMAGVGAAGEIKIKLFIPAMAPEAKMVQAKQYGAEIIPVKGNYDKAFDMSLDYTKKTGCLSRNTAYNPLTIEGKKTASLEIVKQLGKTPDYVFVPAGDGVILSGIYKGFIDLKKIGIISQIPEIIMVQSTGSCAISRAIKTGNFNEKIISQTIADSIAVDIPRNGYHVLKYIKEYNGCSVLVTDIEILKAQKKLSEETGLFAEPAAAAVFAGFLKKKNNIDKAAAIVLLITGSGLKDIKSAKKSIALAENRRD